MVKQGIFSDLTFASLNPKRRFFQFDSLVSSDTFLKIILALCKKDIYLGTKYISMEYDIDDPLIELGFFINI